MAEPEWDQATRDLVAAHAHVPSCPSCGGDPALCQDPARQFDWRVPDPTRCHRTTALREAQSRMREDDNPALDALIWQVRLLDPTSASGAAG